MEDFEAQLGELERKRREELTQSALQIESTNAAHGRYQSGATVSALLKLCEENHSLLLEDITNEIRFFYERRGTPVDTMITCAKEHLAGYREELNENSRLNKLQRILNMPSVAKTVENRLVELEPREELVFRRLEIELPMLDEFMTEDFQLIGNDGAVVRDTLKGRYTDGQVITFDVQAPITAGNHLLRQLPNGLVEDFVVVEPEFRKGFDDISDSFIIKVRRTEEPPAVPSHIINNITANFSGANARMNVSSVDNSTNINTANQTKIFQKMREAAQEGIKDAEVYNDLKKRIDALEEASGSSSFASRYNEFISAAASHMTIFTPFIPALTSLLNASNN